MFSGMQIPQVINLQAMPQQMPLQQNNCVNLALNQQILNNFNNNQQIQYFPQTINQQQLQQQQFLIQQQLQFQQQQQQMQLKIQQIQYQQQQENQMKIEMQQPQQQVSLFDESIFNSQQKLQKNSSIQSSIVEQDSNTQLLCKDINQSVSNESSTVLEQYAADEQQQPIKIAKKIRKQKKTTKHVMFQDQEQKIQTQHTPTNMMNSLIPFLLKKYSDLPCQEKKDRKVGRRYTYAGEELCGCKLCQDYSMIKSIKQSRKNKNLGTFRQIWESKLVRLFSEEYILYYAPREVLNKKKYINSNDIHRLSQYKVLDRFLIGVRNHQKFIKIL